MSIDEIIIGNVFIGNEKFFSDKNEYRNLKAVVTNKTANSVEVFITAVSKEGVDCYQWFTIKDFENRFKWVR